MKCCFLDVLQCGDLETSLTVMLPPPQDMFFMSYLLLWRVSEMSTCLSNMHSCSYGLPERVMPHFTQEPLSYITLHTIRNAYHAFGIKITFRPDNVDGKDPQIFLDTSLHQISSKYAVLILFKSLSLLEKKNVYHFEKETSHRYFLDCWSLNQLFVPYMWINDDRGFYF